MLCRRIVNSCDRYALYLYSGMDILSSCFLCLVQHAPTLPVCRAFVVTATVLPGFKPVDMMFLQSHAAASVLLFLSRKSTACHGHPRSSTLPVCRAFVVTATVLPGFKPVDMMFLQSHAAASVLLFLSRKSTACHGHPRSRFT